MLYTFHISIPDMGYASNGVRWYFGYTVNAAITLDGVQAGTVALKGDSPSTWSSALTATAGPYRVSGKTTGTTRLKFALSSDAGSSRSVFWEFDLAVDPAAAQLSASGAVIGNTIPITLNSFGSSLRYTITWAMGGRSGTVVSGLAAASCSWNTAGLTALLQALPAATSGTCVLTCQTYDTGGVFVGSSSLSVTLTVPAGVSPTCDPGAVTFTPVGQPTGWNVYLSGISRLSITCDTSKMHPGTGSSLTGYSTLLDGAPCLNPTAELTAGTHTAAVTVTDARGRSCTVSQSITVLPYAAPGFGFFDAVRADADLTPDDGGTRIRIRCSLTCSPCGGRNSAVLTAHWRPKGGTAWTATALTDAGEYHTPQKTDFSPTASYELRLTATDTVGRSGSVCITIPTAQVAFHMKESGKSAAFFGYAGSLPDGVLNVAGTLAIGGDAMADFITETGQSGGWQWRRRQSGCTELWFRGSVTPTEWTVLSASGMRCSEALSLSPPCTLPEGTGVFAGCAATSLCMITGLDRDGSRLTFRLLCPQAIAAGTDVTVCLYGDVRT